jgi:hypothetical protein
VTASNTAPLSSLFDTLEALWERPVTRRWLTRGLISAFLLSIGLIELSRQGLLPTVFGHPLPTNHFQAVSWTVTLLLIVEVLDLIFGLAGSMSRAIGKQLEIFSLVLLRKSFDELPSFPEPLVVEGHTTSLLHIGALAGSALAIFAILIPFYATQRRVRAGRQHPETASFVRFKKVICLLLLVAFLTIGAAAGIQSLTIPDADSTLSLRFFELFYTILVFADLLVVLASLGTSFRYEMVFRNFGFAVVTVTLRLALAAHPYTNCLLGLGAALFAWLLGETYARAVEPERRPPG